MSCEFYSPDKCFLGVNIQPGTDVGLSHIQPTIQQLWEEEPNLERCHDENEVNKPPRAANVPQQQQIYDRRSWQVEAPPHLLRAQAGYINGQPSNSRQHITIKCQWSHPADQPHEQQQDRMHCERRFSPGFVRVPVSNGRPIYQHGEQFFDGLQGPAQNRLFNNTSVGPTKMRCEGHQARFYLTERQSQ